MAALFPDAALYDEPKSAGTRAEVNGCDLAFVAVPTPRAADGSCDTSVVESVTEWLETPVIALRSTVSVGTTRRLATQYRKRVVFQPAYGPGATPDHPFSDPRAVDWIIIGGEPADTSVVAQAWTGALGPGVTIRETTPETAELVKYMENTFLATKVLFCNEFFDIAQRFGVDYEQLREMWLLDPRIGRSHTAVHPEARGFGGDCLPKDLDAIIKSAELVDAMPRLLREVAAANRALRTGVLEAPQR
jgi:UDPglucose 6-dehydrogenase